MTIKIHMQDVWILTNFGNLFRTFIDSKEHKFEGLLLLIFCAIFIFVCFNLKKLFGKRFAK